MNQPFVPHLHNPDDLLKCRASVRYLRKFVTGTNRSLVFFVGAGISNSGKVIFPPIADLLKDLFSEAIKYIDPALMTDPDIQKAMESLRKSGFEITLNDLNQVSPRAAQNIFQSFLKLERLATPNNAHRFLAYWLSTGGTVITTNYDRLIEREGTNRSHLKSRYRETGKNSFSTWADDLKGGGTLFKIHGSLDDVGSCLGVLERVGMKMSGDRADLLREIFTTRPVCFIGWAGSDPDIPPLLHEFIDIRPPALPIFWLHYEGAKFISIALERPSALVRPFSSQYPILSEAGRAGMYLLKWNNRKSRFLPSHSVIASIPRLFHQVVYESSQAGIARFVGISFRRARQWDMARRLFTDAKKGTVLEKVLALQEEALTYQQKSSDGTSLTTLLLLSQASRLAGNRLDPISAVALRFGVFSQTIVELKRNRNLIWSVPINCIRYYLDILRLRRMKGDSKTVALHEALLMLYLGRLEFSFIRNIGIRFPYLGWLVLIPFHAARKRILAAKDIHIHSLIDILSYRAVAMAYFGKSIDARTDIPEIDHLVDTLRDSTRKEYWQRQKNQILLSNPGI